MVFEDLTGSSSGFTSDSDGVNLSLDITMSDDSARNLWDVQAAIQQIATDLQTAVRAAADFNSYLIAMRETSQTIKMPNLGMEGGEGGNISYQGGRVDTGSVPMTQSETGMASRIGEMEENASGAGGGAMAARGTGSRPFDPGEAVSQLTNIAWMASMAGGQGGASPVTQASYENAYQYALTNPFSPQVQAARYAGQQGTARAFAASRILSQGLPAAQQFLRGGGVGGIASMLGRLGTIGAIGYGGYQLINAGLETYAQSRAMGINTLNSDHGAGWGFDQRLGQAGMSLSPYVTQEEAQQIYGTAVGQGWASRRGGFAQGDFSSAVNFMYGSAVDYNMSPEASAQLLQTNSLGAGESVAALSEQLLTLKKTIDGTGVSMEAATNSFTSFTSSLISGGASPGEAARIATGTIRSFAGNTYLGQGAGVAQIQAAMGSSSVQAIIGGLTGNLPGAAFAGSNTQGGLEAFQGVLHQLALQYSSQSGLSKENQVAQFRAAYISLTQQPIDYQTAEEMMNEAVADPNFITRGQKDTSMTLEHKSAIEAWWGGLDDLSGWAGGQTGHGQSLADAEKDSALINSYSNYSPEINTLLNNSGDNLQSLVLYGPNGKPVMQDGNRVAGANIAKWFDSQEHYNQFNNPTGGYYIQGPGGNKYNSQNIGLGGSNAGATGSGSTSANTVYITLSEEAKQYFATDKSQLDLSDGKN